MRTIFASAYNGGRETEQGRNIFPANLKEQILATIDIVAVLKKWLPLQKKGKDYICKCPFHKEGNPSFHVEPNKQIYGCFGCGDSGNVLDFLIRYKKINYLQALLYLGKEIGMQLRFRNNSDGKRIVYLASILPEFYGKSIYDILGYSPDEYQKVNQELQLIAQELMSDDIHSPS